MSYAKRSSRRGLALILVLMFAGAAGVVSVAMIHVARNRGLSSHASHRAVVAQNAAEGFMHYGVTMLRRNRNFRGAVDIVELEASTGVRGRVEVSTLPGARILVVGRGTYQSVPRASQVILRQAQI